MGMDQLEQRLLRLEQNVRKWRAMMVALILLLAFGVTLGQTKTHSRVFDTLTCNQLLVVKGDTTICRIAGDLTGLGKELVQIGRDGYREGGSIVVSSKNGNQVCRMEAWKHGGWFSVSNKEGLVTTTIATNLAGDGVLSTQSSSGMRLVDLSTTTGNRGSITTYSSGGEQLVRIASTESGDGALVVNASDGKAGVSLLGRTRNNTGGSLILYNKAGGVMATMYADKYGNGMVGAWSHKGGLV